ncbi:FAD-dependent oxidoreductase [Piscinibacter sakaiensis]|uniref:FAD-dependent oxidoreductase n=1 Tax=Piscinibacter sakaiensis TaxID=1547922 RepID=UPI00372A7DC3
MESPRRPPGTDAPWRVAIVGAGVAGAACARALAQAGAELQVFDKSRGPGGRLATRDGRSPARAARPARPASMPWCWRSRRPRLPRCWRRTAPTGPSARGPGRCCRRGR